MLEIKKIETENGVFRVTIAGELQSLQQAPLSHLFCDETHILLDAVTLFVTADMELLNAESIAWTNVFAEDGALTFRQHIPLAELLAREDVYSVVHEAVTRATVAATVTHEQTHEQPAHFLYTHDVQKVMTLFEVDIKEMNIVVSDEVMLRFREACGKFHVVMDAEFNVVNVAVTATLLVARKVQLAEKDVWQENIVTLHLGQWMHLYPLLRATIADAITAKYGVSATMTPEQKRDLIEVALITKDKELFKELTR